MMQRPIILAFGFSAHREQSRANNKMCGPKELLHVVLGNKPAPSLYSLFVAGSFKVITTLPAFHIIPCQNGRRNKMIVRMS